MKKDVPALAYFNNALTSWASENDLEMRSPDQTVRIRSHTLFFDISLAMDTPITLHLAQLCSAAEDCFLSIVHVTFAMAQRHSVHDKPFFACQDAVA